MIGRKKKEGHPIAEKPEDRAWREWFSKLSLDEHNKKLRDLGLDEEDLKEFDDKFTGGSERGQTEVLEEAPKNKPKKGK